MGGIDRRSVFVAATGAAVLPTMAQPTIRRLPELKKEAAIACLYHCDFGDRPRFVQMLQNIANHYSVYGNPLDLQICVVAHGQGVKFFLETLEGTTWKDEAMVPQLFQRVRDVAKNGLQVFLGDITFERLKLDRSRTSKDEFLSFVPSGVATVTALQTKGYA